MSLIRDIYDQTDRPVGQTTLRRLILCFAVFLAPAILFTYIADEVIEGDTINVDNEVLLGIYHHSTPVLNEIVLRTTDLGGVLGVLGFSAIAVGIYMLRSKWQACAQIVAGIAGAGLLNFILKLLFERNRPDLWHHLIIESSYSFPSGHAMLSSALGLSLVVIAWHTKARWWAVAGAILYIGYIGFTRLYLGVHYPTDIVAGWCVSAAWVVIVTTILGNVTMRRKRKKLNLSLISCKK